MAIFNSFLYVYQRVPFTPFSQQEPAALVHAMNTFLSQLAASPGSPDQASGVTMFLASGKHGGIFENPEENGSLFGCGSKWKTVKGTTDVNV